MIKKTIIVAVAGILSCSAAYSQSKSKHEVSVSAAAGLSTLSYSTEIGDSKSKAGGSFSLGYNYRFTDKLSVNTGLELSIYNSKMEGREINDVYATNDGISDLEFNSNVTGYIEKQNATFVNIPIMVQYEESAFGDHRFYVAGGFKFGIPISAKYTVERAIISNFGYYPDQDNITYSDQNFMGFGIFSRAGLKDDLDLKLASIASVEAGLKWKLPNARSLYTGAYFDYGLNGVYRKGYYSILDRKIE